MSLTQAVDTKELRDDIMNSIKGTVLKISEATGKTITSGFVQGVSELVFGLTEQCISRDLIAFSLHDKRKEINEQDALLIARHASRLPNFKSLYNPPEPPKKKVPRRLK